MKKRSEKKKKQRVVSLNAMQSKKEKNDMYVESPMPHFIDTYLLLIYWTLNISSDFQFKRPSKQMLIDIWTSNIVSIWSHGIREHDMPNNIEHKLEKKSGKIQISRVFFNAYCKLYFNFVRLWNN